MSPKEFAASYEVYYWRHSKEPTLEEFNREFETEISPQTFELWTNSDKFRDYLQRRGVLKQYVTPEQLSCIDKLLDLSIPTLNLRLKAAGVSTETFIKWKRQPEFRKVLRDRTNALTEEERFEVMQSLTNRAKNGSVSAQKLFFELSGDYTPTTRSQHNVSITDPQQTVRQLIEVMQRYISPQTLAVIITEFEGIILGTKLPPKTQILELEV